MSKPLRHIPEPDHVVLIDNRAFQARFLLKPSNRVNDLILGVLAKAQIKYGFVGYAPTFLSNHEHLMLAFRDAHHQARTMAFIDGNIARELGGLHKWEGKFWHDRFSSTLVANDEASQVQALKYLLEQGCKENLVSSPRHWPGVHAARSLLSGRNPTGVWVDRTALYEARRRKRNRDKIRPIDFEQRLELKISPLPCWAHLSAEQYRQRIADLVRQIEEETAARHRAEKTRPLGRKAVLAHKPHHRPKKAKKSRLPLVRAASETVRQHYLDAYRIFVRAYRAAADKLRSGVLDVDFPPGCFPPPRSFVRAGPA